MLFFGLTPARADVLPFRCGERGHLVAVELRLVGLEAHPGWVVVATPSTEDPTKDSEAWTVGSPPGRDLGRIGTHPVLRSYPAEGWAAFQAGGPLPPAVPCAGEPHYETWTPSAEDPVRIVATWALEEAGPETCRLVVRSVDTVDPPPSSGCDTVGGWGAVVGAGGLLVMRRRRAAR